MRRAAVAVATRGMATRVGMRTAVSTIVRDDVSRVATKVKEEVNGQALDVVEMADAARASQKAVQEAFQRNPDGGGDPKVKAKLQGLQTSLKAYTNRLNNLATEAKSIHREAETLVKHVWGNETAAAGGDAAAPAADAEKVEAEPVQVDDFDAEAPHIAKILDSEKAEPVDAEPAKASAGGSSGGNAVEEEVLEIEIETPEEDIPITTITQELYEKGIDFADCHDAAALRKRYADMKAGKFEKQAPPQQQDQQRAAPPPHRPTQDQQQHGSGNPYGNTYNQNTTTNETGVAFDPHPGAMRKMLDPMKQVWEVKQELARENGVDVNGIDLWSGPVKLDDHKRLYDYGSQLQTNPIEVRQKGDMPAYGRQ